jgi:hypothetical protein
MRTATPWILLCSLVLALPGWAQTVTFRFAPPDGTQYVETTTQTIAQQTGSNPPLTETTTLKTRVKFRKTAGGYTMTCTPLLRKRVVNGKEQKSASDTIWAQLTLTYELDAAGTARTIHGYEAVPALVKAKYPPDVAAKLIAALNTKKLIAQQMAEWNQRLGEYRGKAAKVGGGWTRQITSPLPSGLSAPMTVTAKFLGTVARDGVNCLRVALTQQGDPKALAKAMNTALRGKLTPAQAAKLPTVTSLTVSGSGERLIDPATMLEHANTYTRTTVMRLTPATNGHLTVTTTEKRATTYAYEKRK